MNESLTTYRVASKKSSWGLEVEKLDEKDPRGQLLVWEPPQSWASYVIGADPTMGVRNWCRATRTDEDEKHDNAALEVFRQGSWRDGQRTPDVQVAEWVGPIDPEDFAYILNFVGRLFPGNSEEQQALMCIEIYPGPVWLTQRVLHDQYGYERFPAWLVEGKHMIQQDTGRKGWISNASTRRDLWVRSGGAVGRKRVVLNSKWFVEEMVACTPDNFVSLTARAKSMGRSRMNDDRVVGGLIGLWFCNEWQIGQEASEPTGAVKQIEAPDWQLSSLSVEEMKEIWEQRMLELQE